MQNATASALLCNAHACIIETEERRERVGKRICVRVREEGEGGYGRDRGGKCTGA